MKFDPGSSHIFRLSNNGMNCLAYLRYKFYRGFYIVRRYSIQSPFCSYGAGAASGDYVVAKNDEEEASFNPYDARELNRLAADINHIPPLYPADRIMYRRHSGTSSTRPVTA